MNRYKKARIKIGENNKRTCCTYSNLGQYEKVIITFNKAQQNPWDSAYTATAQYDASQRQQTIELTPGKYSLHALLIDNLGFTIPKGCKQICVKMSEKGKCEEYTQYPDKNEMIKPAILGGLTINNETGYFELTTEKAKKLKRIEITVMKVPTPTCVDTEGCTIPECAGISEMGMATNYTKEFIDYAMPKIILNEE